MLSGYLAGLVQEKLCASSGLPVPLYLATSG